MKNGNWNNPTCSKEIRTFAHAVLHTFRPCCRADLHCRKTTSAQQMASPFSDSAPKRESQERNINLYDDHLCVLQHIGYKAKPHDRPNSSNKSRFAYSSPRDILTKIGICSPKVSSPLPLLDDGCRVLCNARVSRLLILRGVPLAIS